MQADAQRIIEIYHRNGRFDVTVVPQIIERPNNRVDLIFEINEGEKTGVKIDQSSSATTPIRSSRLKDVIKTSTSNFLSFLQTTDVYDPDRIEADRDLIRRFYLKHGYADVQVVSATGEYDPAQEGLHHHLHDRGRRRTTTSARSTFNPTSARSIRSRCGTLLRMHHGDVYNGEAVEKTVEDLTVEIAKRGYPFATVRPRGDRNPQTRTDQRHLRHRRGHARLHRAHQHPRQHPHPRLRDPARIRYLRRRSRTTAR